MPLIAGIDFGTSNSSVAFLNAAGRSDLLALEVGKPAMPTALFFEDHGDVLYGTAAMRAFIDREPGRLMRNIKRVLGSSLMGSTTQINGHGVKFTDILTRYLRALKGRLEEAASEQVDHVVMGRPVRFTENGDSADDLAERQLLECAERAGFRQIVFQFEPVAAAFAHERAIEGEKLACVVDIGGGTSDFTVLKVGNSLATKPSRGDDILANTGVRVGGADFDKLLCLRRFMPELGYGGTFGSRNIPVPTHVYGQLSDWSEVNFAYTAQTLRMVRATHAEARDPERYGRLVDLLEQERGHELLRHVEATKIDLAGCDQARVRLDCVRHEPELTLTRTDFETCVGLQVDKIEGALRECLRKAQVKPRQIDVLILTGGSTDLPLIRRRLRTLLPEARWSEANKFSSVATGLAEDGRRRFAA